MLAAGAAAPAAAKTICVATAGATCDVTEPTAADAFDHAAAGDRIELGPLTAAGPLADGGRQLSVTGAGEGATVLAGGLTLSDPGSEISAATLGALDLAGTATRVRVEGAASLRDGALLRAAAVTGHVHAAAGTSRLETVALDLAGGPGLRVGCDAVLEARHLTLAGTPDAAVTTDCAGSEARVRDSILWAPFAGPGSVVTSYSDCGPSAASSAGQLVDLTGIAPEIDRGGATASLSGLLGGYRADADAGSVEATFLDPAGRPLGAPVVLAAPSAAERANATTLLPRGRTDPIPPLARSVAVTMRAARATGGYGDAYFDNLALAVAAPGAPPPPPDPGPGAPPVKPFAGIRVLTDAATVGRRGRIAMRLACVDGTVGGCDGVLTLAGALRRGSTPAPLALARVALGPGATRRVHLRLDRRVRRAVRRRCRIRMSLFAAVRDGQGLTRTSTVPITLRWRRR